MKNMTHQCDIIRDKIFDYRRGDLSEMDAAMFEVQLADCPDCALYAERFLDMMMLAASDDAWLPANLDDDPALPDRLFASIMDAVEPVDVSKAPVVQLHFGLHEEEEEEEEIVSTSRWPLLLVAATIIIAGGALIYSKNQSPIVQAPSKSIANKTQKDITPTNKVETPEQPTQKETWQALSPKKVDSQAVKIFANKDATWTLNKAKTGKSQILNLTRGTVLVEFLPKRGETLKVIAGETQVDVVGTVFYVVATPNKQKDTQVGVLTGKVRVKPNKRDKVQVLEGGQALDSQKSNVQPINNALVHQKLVDLDQHNAQLALHANRSTTKSQKHQGMVKKAPTKPKAEPLTILRESAHKALVEKRYSEAARLNEKLLKRLSAQSSESASVRLELANIYMSRLGKKQRAAFHLKQFVKHHPHDVAASSARSQLCKILGAGASDQCPKP